LGDLLSKSIRRLIKRGSMAYPRTIFKNRLGHFRAGWRIAIYVTTVFVLFKLLDRFGESTLMRLGESPGDYELLVHRFISKFLVLLASLLPGLALLKWLDRRPLAMLGLGFYKGAFKELCTGVLISLIMVILHVLILWGTGGATFAFNGYSWSLALYLACVLLVLMVSAAYEEVLFRGYIFQALIEGSGFWIALVIYSLLFGAAHLTNDKISVVSIAVTIVAGAFLGIIYYKTRALWMAIGAHFVWNFMLGPVMGLGESKFLTRTLFTSGPAASGPFKGMESASDIVLGILCLAAAVYLWKAQWLRPRESNRRLWAGYPESEILNRRNT